MNKSGGLCPSNGNENYGGKISKVTPVFTSSALCSVLKDGNFRGKLINLLDLFGKGGFYIDLSNYKKGDFINIGSNECEKYLITSQKELTDFIFSRILRRYGTATKINKKELEKVITLEIPKELSLPDGVMEILSIEQKNKIKSGEMVILSEDSTIGFLCRDVKGKIPITFSSDRNVSKDVVRKIQPEKFYSYLNDYFKYFFNVNDLSELSEDQINEVKELLSDFYKNKNVYYKGFCIYCKSNYNADFLEFPKDFNEYINQVIPIDVGRNKFDKLVDILLGKEIKFSSQQLFKFTEYFLENGETRPKISNKVSKLKTLYEKRIPLVKNFNSGVRIERCINSDIKIKELELDILRTSFPYLKSVITLLEAHKEILEKRKNNRIEK